MCGRPICQDVESLDPGSVRWMAMNGSAKPEKRGVFGMERLATCLLKQRFGCFFWLSDVFLTLVLVFVSWNAWIRFDGENMRNALREDSVLSRPLFHKNARQLWGKWPSKKPGKIWFCPKIVPSRSLQESNMGVLTEKVIYKWGIFHWNVWLPEDTRTSSSGVYNSSLFLLLVNWLFWGVCPIFRQINVNRAGTEAHMQLIWLMDSI